MIRLLKPSDHHQIIQILENIQEAGDSYFFINMSGQELLDYWLKPDFARFVFEIDGKVAGAYIVGPNPTAPGRFSGIANASYIVSNAFRGRGVGKNLALHSIDFAKQEGYTSMQFNRVVATNTAAVNLWQFLGFEIVGTVPKSFKHKTLGFVDSYIMYRAL